jgi:hypothetical protein
MTDEQQDEVEVPVKERAEALKLAALATHGYLTPEGEVLDTKIEDVIFDQVVKAVVFKPSERKTTAITRTALTRSVVPNMAGPGDYSETEDPEAAELAWTMVNTDVWRMCDTNTDGRIQSRLNGEQSVILCRTGATAEKGVQGVYVTSNWTCILADFITPDQKRVERALNQQAANGAMGAERLPEYGKRFRRELNAATKTVLSTGVAKIDRQIEAADGGPDDE